MLVLGLTGGIATGKSTVSKRLREFYGLPVVDADVIAREVVEPGTPAYKAIVAYFGGVTPDLLLPNGGLNRAALGRSIFGNESHRKKLNSIVHPAVRRAMAWAVIRAWLGGAPVVVLDVPLLFESNLDRFCGTSVLIYTSDELQYERLRQRDVGLSETEARDRIKSQMPMVTKVTRADHVVDNTGSLEELYANLDKVIARVRPSTLRTWIEWFPPFGLLAAALTYFTRKPAAVAQSPPS